MKSRRLAKLVVAANLVVAAAAGNLVELDSLEGTAVVDRNPAVDSFAGHNSGLVDLEHVGNPVAEDRNLAVEVVASLADSLVDHLEAGSFEEKSAVASLAVDNLAVHLGIDFGHKQADHVVEVDSQAEVGNE